MQLKPNTRAFQSLHLLLASFALVWLLAFLHQASEVEPQVSAYQQLWTVPADTGEAPLLQQLQRSPALLFLHQKQQADYQLVLEFGKLALMLIPLLLPLCFLLLLWFIRAGPGRRFRLALWHDANLHKKRLYYQLSLK
ncbi:hypothetical protein [Rheinheimera tangshanensis]|jgi:hypothetical protein|uniref:Uncharacterized protein n=1 Tax=Rheinheimera tangshanensis TaxID=400153 RepID=A0A5C8M2Q2_9GAMM|nr:hypothetical protein [Rheinheimera tangshanensis]TXK82188.1 hypothetical protein FU839_04690 [Rheinheimera tangshanensis]GGM52770.1 hypothetical protein GCM10010920_11460 [Rheinheimera tangshanensis]